ncbi:FkbM family methyltransferase [Frateuria sp. MAH-13]|uniref:FkbM family methyltransferase n=1 Tax=Frateuria flava TaxID=2821489 RepID=A0ABS4DQX5_9GAMM|nr:FkbM family methyltransferase [Frateuria flava]MBP1475462.1 FkbM family methyltransferase [Frateuria flava]
MSFISYAQNYEDVMLARALRGVEQGFYIDVGAQDPVNDSVTKALYDQGWRGINVEPVTHWFEKLCADRPRDINLQLAVSERPGTLHLFEVVDSGLSTTDTHFASRHASAGHLIRESDVACVTLDSICDSHRVSDVHFLKIDCEGAEAAALRGIALQQVRPWIILLEATEPNSQTPAYAEWEPLLTSRGYHFVYEDGLNRFYVADEHAELDGAFSYPPNVFDRFVRASEAAARDELEGLRAASASLRHSVDHLHNENERREAALVEHRARLAEFKEREALSTAALAEQRRLVNESIERESFMQAELTRLHGEILLRDREVHRLHSEVRLRDAEVARLHNFILAIHRSTSWRVTFPLRFLKRFAFRLVKAAGQILYFVLRWPARLARPLLRKTAMQPRLRSIATRLAGSDSALTRHARLFLFGAQPEARAGDAPDLGRSSAPMTKRARQLSDEIQDTKQRSDGDRPARPGEA